MSALRVDGSELAWQRGIETEPPFSNPGSATGPQSILGLVNNLHTIKYRSMHKVLLQSTYSPVMAEQLIRVWATAFLLCKNGLTVFWPCMASISGNKVWAVIGQEP